MSKNAAREFPRAHLTRIYYVLKENPATQTPQQFTALPCSQALARATQRAHAAMGGVLRVDVAPSTSHTITP